MSPARLFGTVRVWFVAAWLAMGPAWLMLSATRGQEALTHTYISPKYGYSISWSSPWLKMGESTNALDVLRLTNGISRVVLIGGEAANGDAQLAAELFADGISQLDGVSDFMIVDAGGGRTRFHLTATMMLSLSPGVSQPTTEYIYVYTLIPGQAIVLFDGYGPSELYARAKFEYDQLLATLVLPTEQDCEERDRALPCLGPPQILPPDATPFTPRATQSP